MTIVNSEISGILNIASAFHNLKNSLFSVEVSGKISSIIILLTITSLFWIENIVLRYSAIFISIILSFILFINAYPILLLLCLSVLIKLFIKKNWVLLFIISSLILFPAVVSSGAPTKSSLLLPFVILITVDGLNSIENFLKKFNKLYYTFFFIIFLSIAVLVRMNVPIPIVKSITTPILQEREKTIQLKEIIDFYINSDYRACSLLFQDAQIPLNQKTLNLDRKEIPPTTQSYLDEYILFKKKELGINNEDCKLLICFSDQEIKDKKLVYKIYYKNAGFTRVYF